MLECLLRLKKMHMQSAMLKNRERLWYSFLSGIVPKPQRNCQVWALVLAHSCNCETPERRIWEGEFTYSEFSGDKQTFQQLNFSLPIPAQAVVFLSTVTEDNSASAIRYKHLHTLLQTQSCSDRIIWSPGNGFPDGKNYSPLSSLNLPSFNLKPLLRVLLHSRLPAWIFTIFLPVPDDDLHPAKQAVMYVIPLSPQTGSHWSTLQLHSALQLAM